jgi:hypothetical protein
MAEKWFVYVDLSVFKGKFTELCKIISESSAITYFCVADKYKDFKTFKNDCEKIEIKGIYDYYLTFLKKADFAYLYYQIVPKEKRMIKALSDYLSKGYSGDIESIFTLFEQLKQGASVNSRKEIAEICGLGGNTAENFLLQLFNKTSGTEKGLKITLKNRLKAGFDLGETYGYNRFHSYLYNAVKGFNDIKVLQISGEVYRDLNKHIEGYDEKKLLRYRRYLSKIEEIPLSKLLKVRLLLEENKWGSEGDFTAFIYRLYTE